MEEVKQIYNVPNKQCHYWCDSMAVLFWIKNALKTRIFVGNRVEKIRNLSGHSKWRHIPSKQNPADLTSRGATATDLLNNELWWQGSI